MASASLLMMLIVVAVPMDVLCANIPGSAGNHGSAQAGAIRGGLTRRAPNSAENDGIIHEQRANDEHSVIGSNGQYSFSYKANDSARQERRNSDGSVEGSYSYVDPEGKLVEIEYTADAGNGFRAQGENVPPRQIALAPYPVQDTPAVAQARAKFLEYYQQEWNARKALEAIENATATSTSSTEGESESSTVSSGFISSSSVAPAVVSEQQQVPVNNIKTTDPQPIIVNDDDDDEDSEILSVYQPPSNNVPFSGNAGKINPGVQSSIATPYNSDPVPVQDDAVAPVPNDPVPSTNLYFLQYQVGNVNQKVQPYNSINNFQTGINGNNLLNGPTGPAYFYYVGNGGLPLYVTSYPTNTNLPVSLRATQLGAIPPAAVHDVQTPHYGGGVLRSKQTPPIYVEPKQGYSPKDGSSPFGFGRVSTQNFEQGNNGNNLNQKTNVNNDFYHPPGFPYHGLVINPY